MMKKSQEFPVLSKDFHHLAGHRNVSVDLKYDILCLCLCSVSPLELGAVTA